MTEQAQPTGKASRLLALGKDLMSTARDASIFVLGLLLIAFPATFNRILVDAGFEEGNIVGLKWKANLSRSDQALNDVRARITDLERQLTNNQKILREAQARLQDTALGARLKAMEAENKATRAQAQALQATLGAVIQSNAPLVDQANRTLDGSNPTRYGVVFGADSSLPAARHEIDRASRAGLPAQIYLRGSAYRSVAVVAEQSQAQAALATARRLRGDAYIVRLESWCPRPVQRVGFFECGS